MSKKILVLIFVIIFSNSLLANENQKKQIEARLISTTLYQLFNHKLKIYTDTKHIREVVKMSEGKLELAINCQKSDLVIADKIPKSCEKKICLFFTYDYQFLKNNKNVLGGLFWAKNRVKLIFVRERLEEYGISVPRELEKYLEYMEYL
ncbi:MAG: hypothetical protein DRJ64_05875 [Thermoprotei archaeon]|nr:MAG: hypothetical protein DRJ64_05875 [Thermoprotei archaeon]